MNETCSARAVSEINEEMAERKHAGNSLHGQDLLRVVIFVKVTFWVKLFEVVTVIAVTRRNRNLTLPKYETHVRTNVALMVFTLLFFLKNNNVTSKFFLK